MLSSYYWRSRLTSNFISMATVPDPYSEIGSYFSGWSLKQATSIIKATISAAGSKEVYKQHSPAELVYFIDKITDLVSAVFQLMQADASGDQAKLTKEQAARSWWLTEYEQYCGWHKGDTPWDFFPRHLSQKEFIDPFRALKKVTRYMSVEQWESALKDLRQYALSNTCSYELDPSMKLVEISVMLYKLIEATHLIEVRAIKEDELGPRPKWKRENQGADNKSSKKTKGQK